MWPFSKKTSGRVLPFKSGRDFFEYQCQFGVTDILAKRGMVGLVEIVSKEPGTTVQNATLRIVSRDGGFETFSSTASDRGAELLVGDLVIWVPLEKDPLLASVYKKDERSWWMGLIVAKIAPEIDMKSQQFKILSRYT